MKKFLSIILAIALVVMCFAGCSKGNENKDPVKLDVKYTYDSIYSDFDDSVINAYNSLCDAVVNYESDVRFNVGMLDNVLQLFYTSFPLSYLTSSVDKKSDDSGVTISFKFDEETNTQMAKDFNDKIVEIEKECGFGQANDGVYTLNAYHYVASNMKISENSSISVYETVMNGEGSIFTYANLFEYLILQKDIMAFHILAEDAAGTGWGLSSAKLNDKIYYFDMASEFYANNGEGINYFAMSFKDLNAEGLKNAKYSSQGDAYNITGDDFSACRVAKQWSLEGNNLKITKYDLKEKTIELK